jgi:hypothetical protein
VVGAHSNAAAAGRAVMRNRLRTQGLRMMLGESAALESGAPGWQNWWVAPTRRGGVHVGKVSTKGF